MIYPATQAISDFFEEKANQGKRVQFEVSDDERSSEVDVGILGHGRVRFISRDNDMDVSVRLFNYGDFRVNESNREGMLRACNRSNNEYRFVKFTVDTDDTINVEYDFPVETDPESIGVVCWEIYKRMEDILDKCYHFFRDADGDREF